MSWAQRRKGKRTNPTGETRQWIEAVVQEVGTGLVAEVGEGLALNIGSQEEAKLAAVILRFTPDPFEDPQNILNILCLFIHPFRLLSRFAG